MSRIVAFLIGSIDDDGGVETVLHQLSQSFSAKGMSVIIINLFGSYHNKDKFSRNGCEVIDLFKDKKSYLLTPLYVIKLRRILIKMNVDFTIDMGTHFSMFSSLAKIRLNIKTISCEHVNLYASFKNFFIKNIFCRFSDKIVTLTERDKKSYLKIGIEKVCCIPNYTQYAEIDKNSLLKSENSKILVAVGRLGPQKRFDRLISLWAKIPNKYDYSLHIFGGGADFNKLDELIKYHGVESSCELKGATNNISDVYRNAYALLMTSAYEGYPMVLIESISHGVPVISYDCPTGPSEIIIDGENGFLVDNENEEIFINKLQSILDDSSLRNEMSLKCIEQRFLFSEMQNMILWDDLFDSLTYEY